MALSKSQIGQEKPCPAAREEEEEEEEEEDIKDRSKKGGAEGITKGHC